MYVYKITNNVNNKSYIGITNNYKKRWSNEKSNPKDPVRQQVITKAISKYGKENFTFEILYSNLTIEEACQKEQELIQKYNTLIPEGYNVDKGGTYHPHRQPQFGEKNGNANLTDKEALYIKNNRDKPLYVLYDEFSDKMSYDAFKKCYKHQTYTHLPITKAEYPITPNSVVSLLLENQNMTKSLIFVLDMLKGNIGKMFTKIILMLLQMK